MRTLSRDTHNGSFSSGLAFWRGKADALSRALEKRRGQPAKVGCGFHRHGCRRRQPREVLLHRWNGRDDDYIIGAIPGIVKPEGLHQPSGEHGRFVGPRRFSPFGIVTTPDDSSLHVAVTIGSSILDLKVFAAHPSTNLTSLFPSLAGHEDVFVQPTLNAFAQLGRAVHREVRSGLRALLATDTPCPEALRDNAELREKVILPQRNVKMHLPMAIGDYTDFYAGYYHAFAVGTVVASCSPELSI